MHHAHASCTCMHNAHVAKLSYIIGNNISENQIYGSVDQQEIIVKVYSDILEVREKLLNNYIEDISPP